MSAKSVQQRCRMYVVRNAIPCWCSRDSESTSSIVAYHSD